jgi:paraquat-inducible protein B
LPLDETVKNASAALASIKDAVDKLNTTVAGYGEDSPLYRQLTATMRQLNETLSAVDALATTIEQKPNSLIFGKGKSKATPTPSPTPRPASGRNFR